MADPVTYETFAKLELRVAKVLEARGDRDGAIERYKGPRSSDLQGAGAGTSGRRRGGSRCAGTLIVERIDQRRKAALPRCWIAAPPIFC